MTYDHLHKPQWLTDAIARGGAGAWDEAKHARDHGQFSSKPGAKGDGGDDAKPAGGGKSVRDMTVRHGGTDYSFAGKVGTSPTGEKSYEMVNHDDGDSRVWVNEKGQVIEDDSGLIPEAVRDLHHVHDATVKGLKAKGMNGHAQTLEDVHAQVASGDMKPVDALRELRKMASPHISKYTAQLAQIIQENGNEWLVGKGAPPMSKDEAAEEADMGRRLRKGAKDGTF